MIDGNSIPWYIAGLHFECVRCGGCCSGPDEGYIWVTNPEIELVARFLEMSVGELRRRYLKRVGFRTTIIEQPSNRDCVFLREKQGRKQCMIYPVRPSQCRTWPFWPGNLASPDTWNRAAEKCRGINRGRLCSASEIDEIRKRKRWWKNPEQTTASSGT